MNVVLVKHIGEEKEYVFRVSDELAPYIHKNMNVVCETSRGPALGKTTTGAINGSGAIDIATKHGAYFPLMPILSIEHELLRKAIVEDCLGKIKEYYSCGSVLPF